MKYIFTGTGRCGTVYYARLLTSLGVPCSHEGVFGPTPPEETMQKLRGEAQIIVSNRSREYDPNWAPPIVIAESSYMSAPFLDCEELVNTKVVHLIRHPIKVISSYFIDLQYYKYPQQGVHDYMDYVYKYLPLILDESLSPVHRVTKFYLEWNKLIVQKCQRKIKEGKYLLHKVENGSQSVLNWLGLKNKEGAYADERSNTMKHRLDLFSIRDIPEHPVKDELVEFAAKHGYDLRPREYIPKLFL